jgi:hypothetical protein
VLLISNIEYLAPGFTMHPQVSMTTGYLADLNLV